MRALKTSQSGLSIVQLLVGLAIGAIVTMVAIGNVDVMNKLKHDTESKDMVMELELRTRTAIRFGLKSTMSKSPILTQCMDDDGKMCPTTWTSVELWYPLSRQVTGTYSRHGVHCKAGENCPLQIDAQFLPRCGATPGCDQAKGVDILFRITQDGMLLRQGMESNLQKVGKYDDTNVACKVDDTLPPDKQMLRFANGISYGLVTCTNITPPATTLAGVNPGTCDQGKEVLVGFESGGKPICEKIAFTDPNPPSTGTGTGTP